MNQSDTSLHLRRARAFELCADIDRAFAAPFVSSHRLQRLLNELLVHHDVGLIPPELGDELESLLEHHHTADAQLRWQRWFAPKFRSVEECAAQYAFAMGAAA